jgi:hypothetical protein
VLLNERTAFVYVFQAKAAMKQARVRLAKRNKMGWRRYAQEEQLDDAAIAEGDLIMEARYMPEVVSSPGTALTPGKHVVHRHLPWLSPKALEIYDYAFANAKLYPDALPIVHSDAKSEDPALLKIPESVPVWAIAAEGDAE